MKEAIVIAGLALLLFPVLAICVALRRLRDLKGPHGRK
jgi:uncharacterized membrane protein YhaH (DUF805 family)